MNIKAGDQVRVKRNIVRSEGPYASAGEEGSVVEVFRGDQLDVTREKWHAKVLIAGTIKTLRLTSIEKVKA